ncbi:PAS domain-containing sensor histidine kinase [Azotosporobacter soli]|uniref:PAS domain-containing sensor histidine kinase n=1 Tax=Azotosporobacter soli TaxID=3055040 RepID=UPI0031FE4839
MLDRSALRIAQIYLLFGSLWILFSDQFVSLLTQDPLWITRLSTAKGWLFMLVTSSLLYFLIHRSHHELRSANERYLSVLRAAETYSIIGTNPQGLITVFNAGAEHLLGYSADEVVNRQTVELIHDAAEIAACAAELNVKPGFEVFTALATEQRLEKKYWHYLTKDGRRISVQLSLSPQRDANGVITGFLGIANDVSAHLKAEEALRSSEARFRRITTHLPIAISCSDATGNILFLNPVFEKLFGYTLGDVPTVAAWFEKAYPDETLRESAAQYWQEFLSQPDLKAAQPWEGTLVRKDGEKLIIQIYAALDEDYRYLVFLDITERRAAEDLLREQRLFTDAVLDSVPGMLYLYDSQGRLIRWNRQHERMTGYSTEEMAKMTLLDWYRDDESTAKRILQAVDDCLTNGFAEAEADMQTKNGKKLPMFFTAVKLDIRNETYFTGIGIDITSRKQAEAALLEANAALEQRVEDRTQDLSAANEELTAMNQELMAVNETLLQLNEQLRQTKASLIRSEQMASLARLVAGIAHEINTPVGLCVTLSSHLAQLNDNFAVLFQNGVVKRKDLTDYLAEIQETSQMLQINSERAGKLVSNFKQVSADQASETRRSFNVRQYVDDILLSLRSHLKNSGHQITVSGETELTIDGYPGAFAQIMTNLILNSVVHAYPSGQCGTLRIDLLKQDDHLQLTYQDDGLGMEPDVLEKIFEPFFTTRRNQGGTGLGLSIIYNLVTQLYGGTIECRSTPGQGSIFTLLLPLTITAQDQAAL